MENEITLTQGASVSVGQQSAEMQHSRPQSEVNVAAVDGLEIKSEVPSDAQNADKLLDIAKTEGFEIAFRKLSEVDFEKARNKVDRYSFKNRQEHLESENVTEEYTSGLVYGEENLLDVRIQSLQETVEKLVERNKELEEEVVEISNEREYYAYELLERAKVLEEIAQKEKDEKKKGSWLSTLFAIMANILKMTMVEDKDIEKQKEAETIEKLTS